MSKLRTEKDFAEAVAPLAAKREHKLYQDTTVKAHLLGDPTAIVREFDTWQDAWHYYAESTPAT